MNCAGCSEVLKPWEKAQPMMILGRWVSVASYCDACCHEATAVPGSAEALKRLIRGDVDADESARVEAATPTPYDGEPPKPARPPAAFTVPAG